MTKSVPVSEEYSRLAADYEQTWDAYLQASIAYTLQQLNIEKGQRILDLGCGTGLLLAGLEQRACEVELSGVDLVPAMLTQARKKLPDNVHLLSANAACLPYGSNRFEYVVSSSMFHYIAEPGKALAEVRRVLVPGGKFLLTDWCRDFFSMKLLNAYLHLSGRGNFRMYGSAAMQSLLESSGFKIVNCQRHKISPVWGLMAVSAESP